MGSLINDGFPSFLNGSYNHFREQLHVTYKFYLSSARVRLQKKIDQIPRILIWPPKLIFYVIQYSRRDVKEKHCVSCIIYFPKTGECLMLGSLSLGVVSLSAKYLSNPICRSMLGNLTLKYQREFFRSETTIFVEMEISWYLLSSILQNSSAVKNYYRKRTSTQATGCH